MDTPTGTPPNAVAPLTLNCPASVQVPGVDGPSAPVTYSTPAHSGGVDPVSVACSPSSGVNFALGPTTVSCTGRDASVDARTAACSFTVTLLPYEPSLSVASFMAFGDSITKGEINDGSYLDGSGKCDPGPARAPLFAPRAIQPDFAYPAIVSRLLTARYRKQSFTMVNEGVARTRATEDTGRFADRVAADRPDAVLLLQGILDVYNDVSPASALAADIRAAKAGGAKAVFLGTLLPLAFGAQTCGVTNESVRAANEEIRATAASEGAVLVDTYSAFIGRLDTLMGPDGLHPSAEGQEVIAQLFFDAIKSKFEVAPGATSGPAVAPSAFSRAHVQIRPPAHR